ncbi:hypothetical protein N7508_007043 [Penicillium antarcticum]|uniref:uncharacterized protein n=1 Tax=Penicillium antarcticum TaxID=416450 RepID=UPI00238C145F|nr:uncharacterized protein N7508_007043 [Penicillium antarcticum]KAJ5302180.1 hypothetical protein N7508_007043 [Penicillium antarcticum]
MASSAPTLAVFHHADDIKPSNRGGFGAYSDLIGSKQVTCSESTKSVCTGVWGLDLDTPTSPFVATHDEAKYVVKGEAVVKDEVTGETHVLVPVSLFWIPAGAKASIVSSHGLKTVYVESRLMAPTQVPTSSETLEKKLNGLIAEYVAQNPASKKANERVRQSLPDGSTRSVLESSPFPLSVKSTKGSCLTSVDDKVLGAVTELEAELAESLKERFSSIDLVRFCNSGTEANTYALAAGLAYTGRKKVKFYKARHEFAPFKGLSFHGFSFLTGDITVERLPLAASQTHSTYHTNFEIGAILVEPMQCAGGMRPASEEFPRFLREAANILGTVLIFDEVVISRLDYHVVQGKLSITPDMTTLGKYIGGGMPFGAFASRKEIMGQFDPQSDSSKQLSHSGTFNNNIFTMSAAVAASKIVTKEAIDKTIMLGERARLGMNAILQKKGKSDKVFAIGCGSCVGLHFVGPDADILREICYFHNILQGLWIGRRGFLTFNFAHTGAEVDTFLASFKVYVDLYV